MLKQENSLFSCSERPTRLLNSLYGSFCFCHLTWQKWGEGEREKRRGRTGSEGRSEERRKERGDGGKKQPICLIKWPLSYQVGKHATAKGKKKEIVSEGDMLWLSTVKHLGDLWEVAVSYSEAAQDLIPLPNRSWFPFEEQASPPDVFSEGAWIQELVTPLQKQKGPDYLNWDSGGRSAPLKLFS